MVYIVIVSLVLHLVSFFVMIILYQKIENQKPMDKEKTIREMEDLLVSYTSEMKENNERLVRRMTKISPESIHKRPVDQAEKQDANPAKTDYPRSINNVPSSESIEDSSELAYESEYDQYMPPTPSGNKDQVSFDSSSTANVLSLSKQGYTESEIAKKLQMGAGEVGLLLKLYK